MADCPTTEILAEYLEGGLPPERRLRLEEHLAGCPDCCTSFAQATIFLLEEELGRMPVAPSVPYPLVQIAGSKAAGLGIVLAATGALLWSFHVGSDARREVSAEPPSRPVVVASAAVVDYGAPRLTGGRRWAAFAPAAPVVGELRRGFVDAATPAGVGYRPASQEAGGAGSRLPLAADGAAELLAGEADAAVAALLRAAAIEPDSAELRSDLGAALLA
ncbi:MAG TPA: zf-HC2 domain-containing protein, partial [Thermoanaerobaculia bacterium]|nr:zf-HC2 domain-containing protein [Thermoanaerobaculia bacterium]